MARITNPRTQTKMGSKPGPMLKKPKPINSKSVGKIMAPGKRRNFKNVPKNSKLLGRRQYGG